MPAAQRTGMVFLGAFMMLSHLPPAIAQTETARKKPPGATEAVNLNDADSLLRLAVPRTINNHRQAMTFAYEIDYENRNYSPRGKMLIDYKAKYEVIFIEGLPYRRQIEENQKPLTGQQAAEEKRRYDQTFAERSRMTLDQKREYLKRPWNVDVPLPLLTALFSNRIVGGELVDGRPSIVVESTPRSDLVPQDEEQERALHKQVKLWIDREDLIASRIEATLIQDDALMKKGTVARLDFIRRDGMWLPSQSDVRFEATSHDEVVKGETRETNSAFRRFHVDVRLLPPSDPIPEPVQAQ